MLFHRYLSPVWGLSTLFFPTTIDATGSSRFALNVGANYDGTDICPESCSQTGPDPRNWTVYPHVDRLDRCKNAVILDFAIHGSLKEMQKIRSCSITGHDFDASHESSGPGPINATSESVSPELAWWDSPRPSNGTASGIISVISQLRSYLKSFNSASLNSTIVFGSSHDASVGIYVGASIPNAAAADKLFQPLLDRLQSSGLSKATALQLCGSDRTAGSVVGIMASEGSDLTTAQEAVKSWASAKCIEGTIGSLKLANMTISTTAHHLATPANTTALNETTTYHGFGLQKRGDCKTIKVEANDGCDTLVQKCGLSNPNLITKYNPASDFCSTLMPGQRVCCSEGTLPDIRPKPNSDGSCFVYESVTNDTCGSISTANGLTVKDLDDLNKNTWGWNGCSNTLWTGVRMCLSSGTPPMPAPIPNAKCGPQVPDTKAPSDMKDLASLNQCPLNACCDVWGQCGTTAEFCTDTGLGAPGTAKAGTNGCISNCGTDIKVGAAPDSFWTVGYFEAFNLGRDCLNMDASQIDTKKYTHVHFAFGTITKDFKVDMGDNLTRFEFDQFKGLQGVKKILSFGGWTFSTDPATYQIFRDGTNPTNRETLAQNIANFINANGLDGVDIDWEYPGEPDIKPIPAGDASEGPNYAKFLQTLKNKLGSGKTVSIAAPASFWYLKQFPIKQIGSVVDYIIYMTYDLHGQWDSASHWSNPGCPSGSCLRSQVNKTETLNALSMITKAGVPSNKVVVGVTSYGRSFRMTTPGCTGETCTFDGPADSSPATPGRCTKTGGYLGDAEIKEIIKKGGNVKTWVDSSSNSNIMVYNDVQWVAYMDDKIRDARSHLYQGYNFRGTSNWAIDLEDFLDPPSFSTSDGGPSDGDPKPTWDMIKANSIKGIAPTCDLAHRTGTWTTIGCDIPDVNDALKSSADVRWKAVDASSAWADAMWRWKYCDRHYRSTFSVSVSNFFHMVEQSSCSDLATNTNCDDAQKCQAILTSPDSGAITGAAGYIVWNALTSVHAMIKNYIDSLNLAILSLRGTAQAFVSDFSPVPADNTALLMLLDLLQIPATAAGTAFFKGYLAKLPFFTSAATRNSREVYLDLMKDTSQAAVSAAFAIAEKQLDKTTENEMKFNDLLDATIKQWQSSTDQLAVQLFQGTDDKNLDKLTDLIKDGRFTTGNLDLDGSDADPGTSAGGDTAYANNTQAFAQEKHLERAFFGMAIPLIWAGTSQVPVIVPVGSPCSSNFQGNPSSWTFMSNSDAANSYFCYQDTSYFIGGIPGKYEPCTGQNNHVGNCKSNQLVMLRGLDKLDGKTYGNISKEDILVGALATYTAKGSKNDGKLSIDPTNKSTFDSLWDSDIRTPGFVNIPVCGIKELYANYEKGSSKNYPCN